MEATAIQTNTANVQEITNLLRSHSAEQLQPVRISTSRASPNSLTLSAVKVFSTR